MTETQTDGSTVFSISVMMALFCFRLYWCLVHITFILPSRLSIFPKLMWPFCDISWHPRALGTFCTSTSSTLSLEAYYSCLLDILITPFLLWSLYSIWWGTVGDEMHIHLSLPQSILRTVEVVAFCGSGSQIGEFPGMHLGISMQYIQEK